MKLFFDKFAVEVSSHEAFVASVCVHGFSTIQKDVSTLEQKHTSMLKMPCFPTKNGFNATNLFHTRHLCLWPWCCDKTRLQCWILTWIEDIRLGGHKFCMKRVQCWGWAVLCWQMHPLGEHYFSTKMVSMFARSFCTIKSVYVEIFFRNTASVLGITMPQNKVSLLRIVDNFSLQETSILVA